MKTQMKMPQVRPDYYPMKGGLDLQTPSIALDPGKCFDAQNYLPETSGGYRRCYGYERYDGQASPTAASYWIMPIAQTGTIAAGNTIAGLTSGATGIVLGVFGLNLVMGRVAGTFVSGETLQIAAVTVATSTSTAVQGGASQASDDADYSLLAANDQRAFIQKVPGSGRIRGVWVYNDVTYAFRDNVGGTAGGMYRATPAGWVAVAFGTEISFTTPVAEIFAGNTITGLTSGATATVVKPLLRVGTWTVGGAGTLVLSGVVGTFQNGEALQVGGVTKATSSSVATAITRLPGGSMEFVNANFTGSTATLKMYGCDGVNPAFEFDGTNYIPIHTGMAVDAPSHIMEHKNYLFLSFLGSAQYSALGSPYSWTVVLGAGEIATGSVITGFVPQTGNGSGASMAIFTQGKTFILYGSSNANFTLVPSTFALGYSAFTMQPVGNNTYGLTSRGVQSLITTLNYGDFDFAAISFLIQKLMERQRGKETASSTSQTRNEYRLYWNDGTGICVGLTGDKVNGILPLNYGRVVRCITSHNLSTGEEVTFFGSDDGYVYQDNTGTSFDGAPIEAWIRPAFNNLKSPRVRKQYRRAVFEVATDGFAMVNVTYDLGYANPDVAPAATQPDLSLVGAGGYWDQFTWDRFTWDTQVVADPSISIDGTEKNISFLFYSNRAQDKSHVIQGVNLMYTIRRLER
ncbi:hypothetical protein D9M73_84920 [compost metagenome]